MSAHRTLVLDNEDSFTWNLVELLRRSGDDPLVCRRPELTADLRPARLLISPGPGRPETTPAAMELIDRWVGKLPILGVCLGHQCLGEYFGMRCRRAPVPVHGRSHPVEHDGRGIFAGLTGEFSAMRYHSLILEESDLPECLEVSARCHTDGSDLLMALRHRELPVEGVQFHPESFLTEHGETMLRNFLSW